MQLPRRRSSASTWSPTRASTAIVLTGARETAELFRRLAPRTPLFAETSGKNAIVVMPDADLDLAVADLVHSAFGHAGQKCSAASLAICVGDVYTSDAVPPPARRRRRAASCSARPPTRPPTLAPLIGPPARRCERALTRLDPGRALAARAPPGRRRPHLWSPGIKDGVRPGSWFHQTECFGPVLGLMRRGRPRRGDGDRRTALPFGLTGGIHTLDPARSQRVAGRVEVGNAYINRAITGAIVQRQPFGGWKGSVVGPGAKAGGPNYVAQLGRWQEDRLARAGRATRRRLAAWLRPLVAGLEPAERDWLDRRVRSDAWWQRTYFGIEHDPTGLFCEANVLRFRAASGWS